MDIDVKQDWRVDITWSVVFIIDVVVFQSYRILSFLHPIWGFYWHWQCAVIVCFSSHKLWLSRIVILSWYSCFKDDWIRTTVAIHDRWRYYIFYWERLSDAVLPEIVIHITEIRPCSETYCGFFTRVKYLIDTSLPDIIWIYSSDSDLIRIASVVLGICTSAYD